MKEFTSMLEAITRVMLISGLCLALSGCFGIFRDRQNDYLEAEDLPRTEVPRELDTPPFDDLMVIPAVVDSRGISRKEFELPLPEPLNTSFGVERIVIKRLGDSRWIFVDAPPATVWPRVLEFWEINNMAIASSDPGRGLVETVWLTSVGGDAEAIFESLKSRASRFGRDNLIRNRFQLRVTPGVRSGSSEIYLLYKQAAAGMPVGEDVVWSTKSDDPLVEDTVLSAVAYYLGETINDEAAVSLLAGTIPSESRAILFPSKERPILKYRLSFDRAWVTVGSALENARISVEDRDRSASTYFVYYDELDEDRPGFIKRLFRRDDKIPEGGENRYLVQLQDDGDGVDVTILKGDANAADPVVAERLLTIIKEYST